MVEESKKHESIELARLFKALADENRLAIFQLIRERCGKGCEVSEEQVGRTVSELASEFDLALSTISHHLKELKNAGLIRCQKRGQRVFCSPNYEALEEVTRFLEAKV